jgi:uncharacterized membrane protein
MNKRRTLLTMGAACAACCAPLVWPFMAAAVLGGTGSMGLGAALGANIETVVCITGLVVAGALLAYFGYRWKRNSARETASCEIGGACDPHQAPRAGT